MNEGREITALATRAAFCPAKRRSTSPATSALVFVLFLSLGIVLNLALSPTKQGVDLPLASLRLTLVTATPTTAEGTFTLLLSVTKSEAVFLGAVFLFTFTYFTLPLTRILLALRALQAATLVCRLTDWMQAGVFSPAVGACLFLYEAAFSLGLILFSVRAVALSRKLRFSTQNSVLPQFLSIIFHVFYLMITYAATLFAAALLFLTVRL